MQLTITFLLIALLSPTFVHSCANPAQLQGQCKSCASPTQVLVQGFCYQKITGCLEYDIGPICTQCQNGYVRDKGNCIREAVFFNRTDLSPAPLVADDSKQLTVTEIEGQFGMTHGLSFNKANQYFREINPQLSSKDISKVESQKTKLGTYISIYYTKNGQEYIGSAFYNRYGEIENQVLSPLEQNSTDPVTLIRSLKNLFEQEGYDVYSVMGSNKIDVISNDNLIKRLEVVGNEIKRTDLSIEDLARQKIMRELQFINSQNLDQLVFQREDHGFYIFKIEPDAYISVEFRDFEFILNVPIKYIPPVIQQTISQNEILLLGAFRQFTDRLNPKYLKVLQFAKNQFPQYSSSIVERVESQVVAGTNFKILLNNDEGQGTKYQVTIYHKLDGNMQVLRALKKDESGNISFMFSNNYNYNIDERFFKAYKAMRQGSKIGNIPQIDRVVMKNSEGVQQFNVIYSLEEHMKFRIVGENTELVGYFQQETNILNIFDNIVVPGLFLQQEEIKKCQNGFKIIENSGTASDMVLYSSIRTAIILEKPEWRFLQPILVLDNPDKSQIIANFDDNQSIYKVILSKKPLLKVQGITSIGKSQQTSILGTEDFPFESLIIPTTPKSTSALIAEVNNLANLSVRAYPAYVEAPQILVAAKISTNSYRFIVSTKKSPTDPENKYYIKFDVAITFNLYEYKNGRRIKAKDIRLPSCSEFNEKGECQTCSAQQIAYKQFCYPKIEKCERQALDICLLCEGGYSLVNNSCSIGC